MKQFYTVRDIEDMHAAGVVEIETHDDVVLTDVAREKAITLGMRLNPVEPAKDSRQVTPMPRMAVAAQTQTTPVTTGAMQRTSDSLSSTPALHQANSNAATVDRVREIKAAVVARLGTDKYNDLLEKIIPQVMSQFNK